MNILDVINSLSLVAIAICLAVIAMQLVNAVWHLSSLAKVVPSLNEFLARAMIHDPDPHHHFFSPAAKNRVVWEWRDGRWLLRPESGPLEKAGSPPDRPGSYDGECVTTPKKG